MLLTHEIVEVLFVNFPMRGMLFRVIWMSFLTLGFAVLFLGVLNIDFPLVLVSLGVVEGSLLLWVALVVVCAGGKVLNLVP